MSKNFNITNVEKYDDANSRATQSALNRKKVSDSQHGLQKWELYPVPLTPEYDQDIVHLNKLLSAFWDMSLFRDAGKPKGFADQISHKLSIMSLEQLPKEYVEHKIMDLYVRHSF